MVGTWTYDAVQETIHDHLSSGLQTILQANIRALKIVVEEERNYIQTWANDDEVRSLTGQLLSGQNLDHARLELTEIIVNAVIDDEYLGFAGKGF